MTDHRNLLTEVLAPRYELPAGYDSWGLKSVHPDLRTCAGFRYPWPGNATGVHELDDHDYSCPRRVGDGVCVATTWEGMASSGIPARTLLLVAYRTGEARGNDAGKLRVPQLFVVDVIDGQRLVREHGSGADLRGADLRGADLDGADLSGADLDGADLYRADLYRANLGGHDIADLKARGAIIEEL